MADHDEVLPEETAGYKLAQPKQSLAEYQQMGEFISTVFYLFSYSSDGYIVIKTPEACYQMIAGSQALAAPVADGPSLSGCAVRSSSGVYFMSWRYQPKLLNRHTAHRCSPC